MLLHIDKIINLSTSSGNPPPKIVNQLSIVHESEKGAIVQYYVDPEGQLQGDKESHALSIFNGTTERYEYTTYEELIWGAPKRRITTRKVDRLALKAFPGVGSCAVYKLAYQVLSKIVIPVNNRQKLYPSPTQTITISGNTIHIVFTDPEKVTYQCYRVVLRCEEYAEEYVTYEHELTCNFPKMNGEYEIYTQGYISEGEEVSELSPSYFLTVDVPGQSTSPPTTTAGSDIFVSGLSFTQDNKLRATLTDGRYVDSANKVPEELPVVSQGDRGKFLMVSPEGKWEAIEFATIIDPLHHQMLRFNSITGKWENYTSMDQVAPESAAHIVSVQVKYRKFIAEVDSLLKTSISPSLIVVQQDGASLSIDTVIVLDSTHVQVNLTNKVTEAFDVTILQNAFRSPQTDAGPYHVVITDSLDMLEGDMEDTNYVRLSMHTGDGATFGGRYFTRTTDEPVIFCNISDGGSWNSYGVISRSNTPPANTYNSYGGLTSSGTLVVEGITFYLYAMGGWWSSTGVQYTIKNEAVTLEHGVVKSGEILKHNTDLINFLLRFSDLTE